MSDMSMNVPGDNLSTPSQPGEQIAQPGDFLSDPRKEQAALLLAENKISDGQVAARVGVNIRTITRWKHEPEFAARIKAYRERLLSDVYSVGIADKRVRLRDLDDLRRRILSVFDARATRFHAEVEKATGSLDTRLALEERKAEIEALPQERRMDFAEELADISNKLWEIGNRRGTGGDGAFGPHDIPPEDALSGIVVRERKRLNEFETVTVWRVDTATARLLLETMKNAAIEMGQWDEMPKDDKSGARASIFSQPIVIQVSHRDRVMTEDGKPLDPSVIEHVDKED